MQKWSRHTVAAPDLKPDNLFSEEGNCSAGTMAFRISMAVDQNLLCSSPKRMRIRVDWELKEDGTWRRVCFTISWTRSVEIGSVLLRG